MLYKFDGKQPIIEADTYVSELASVIGDVVIGHNCYIGHGVILRGDYGRIEIGDGTAVEEGVIVHAPPGDTNQIGNKGHYRSRCCYPWKKNWQLCRYRHGRYIEHLV